MGKGDDTAQRANIKNFNAGAEAVLPASPNLRPKPPCGEKRDPLMLNGCDRPYGHSGEHRVGNDCWVDNTFETMCECGHGVNQHSGLGGTCRRCSCQGVTVPPQSF